MKVWLLIQLRREDGCKGLNLLQVLILNFNYGFSLDPEPTIIPFHKVADRIKILKEKNKDKHVRILRNGMLIKIKNKPGRDGIWKIVSCKANGKLDLIPPHLISKSGMWGNVLIRSLLNTESIELVDSSYIGIK